MATNETVADRTLDCSDLDNYIGKPMTPFSLKPFPPSVHEDRVRAAGAKRIPSDCH